MIQSFSFFGVQFVKGITAGHLNVIMSVPFYDRDEKDTEITVSHKYLVSAIASTQAADHCFCIIEYFLSLAHATYKKHKFLLIMNVGFDLQIYLEYLFEFYHNSKSLTTHIRSYERQANTKFTLVVPLKKNAKEKGVAK